MNEITLRAQIEEIDYELGQRKNVYARLVGAGKMRQSIADLHCARLRAARATLERVQAQDDLMRQRLA